MHAREPLFPLSLLERADRALLARLLTTLAPTFPGATPEAIYALAHASDAPAPLVTALRDLAAAAHVHVRQDLLARDTARRLPTDQSPEDTALSALLDAPELLRAALAHAVREPAPAFTWLAPERDRAIDLSPSAVARIERGLRDLFGHAEVHLHETAARATFTLACAGVGAIERSERVPTCEAARRPIVVLEKKPGHLGVHAPRPFGALLGRLFGEALAGHASHYAPRDLLTLAPLAEGSLSPGAGIVRVELRAVELFSPRAKQGWSYAARDGDVREGPRGARVREDLTAGDATPAAATLALTLADGRAILVAITPASSTLRVEADGDAEATVRAWLVAEGYLRGREAEAPASEEG